MDKTIGARFLGSYSDNRKSKIQNLKWAGCLAIFVLLVGCVEMAEAQQPKKVPRIGVLWRGAPGSDAPVKAGLRDLGYIEGQNITIEYRYAEGKRDRLAALASELVRLKVDIIMTETTDAALAAKQATSTIPIVMISSNDPMGTGLVASLARPGGNVTGLTSISGELGGKILELLKEIVPRLSRVVIPGLDSPVLDFFIKETEIPARALKVHLIRFTVRGPEDFEGVFEVATKERANALLVRLPPGTPPTHRKQLVELAARNRLPAIYTASNWVTAGGLISYGPDRNVMFQRAATYVDKILKGTKPADLPVEQPMKFELVINLKTAKQIGLTIPPNVLARADRVIK
jgi:putative ABC transport system substrate-binding protein